MPKQSFPLKPGSEEKVELEWKGGWKGFTVRAEGRELGQMNGQKELSAGGRYSLSDGSVLEVKLARSALTPELQVLRDGVPLPGTASDPATRVKTAAGIAFFIAGLNIVLGLIAVLGDIQFLQNAGLGYPSLVFGAVFLGLALGIKKASIVALIAAIVVFAADGILGLILTIEAGGRPAVGGIVFRVFLLLPLIRAVSSVKAVREAPTRLEAKVSGGATGAPVNIPLAPSDED